MNIHELSDGLQHIGIPTLHMIDSLDFYQKIGFTLVYETVIPNTDNRVCFLKFKGIMLEIWESEKAEDHSIGGIDHVALGVTNIEKVYEQAVNEGLPIIETKIMSMPFWEKGIKYFNLKGPNGEKIEFTEIVK